MQLGSLFSVWPRGREHRERKAPGRIREGLQSACWLRCAPSFLTPYFTTRIADAFALHAVHAICKLAQNIGWPAQA